MRIFKRIRLCLCLVVTVLLCSCQGTDTGIEGSWHTEKNGVVMTVSFSKDGKMSTVCNVTDKAKADAAGVKKESLAEKNISCYYSVDTAPDISELSEEEQAQLKGKYLLTAYPDKEAMQKKQGGDGIYFTIVGNKLVTTQKTGEYNAVTGVPVYSDTVFERNE